MSEGEESQDPRAELFEAIGHPMRIKILQVLSAKEMRFADLKRAVGIESSGNMSFHLMKLRHLVRTTPEGNYALTDAGKEALWSVGNIGGILREPGDQGVIWRVQATGRSRQRVLVTLVVVALIILGSIVGLQQLWLGAQQQAISSQQQELGLYVNQAHPFAVGQGASLVVGHGDFSSYSSETSETGMYSPTQVAFDKLGNLWVSDFLNNRLLEFEPPFASGMKASTVIGQADFLSNVSGVSANQLYQPVAIAFDSSGDLWATDAGNSRVLEFVPPFSSGMSASVVIGQRDFVDTTPTSVADVLGFASSLAFGRDGSLWVLDSSNNRVLEYQPPFLDGMNASIVIGQKDFGHFMTATSQSGLNPFFGSISFDPSGNLWVGDDQNSRILEFKPPFSNGMQATLVIGQRDFNSSTLPLPQPTSPYTFDFVGQTVYLAFFDRNFGWTLAFDQNGDLWTSYDGRLLEFRPPFANGMGPSEEIGQPDFTSTGWTGGQGGFREIGRPVFDSAGNLWVPDSGSNRVLEFTAAPNAQAVQAAYPLESELLAVGMTGLVVLAIIVVFLFRRRV